MMTSMKHISFLILFTICSCEIHNLHITNDANKYILLNTFGFNVGGELDVNLINFRTTTPENSTAPFGFSLVKTTYDDATFYFENYEAACTLEDRITALHNDIVINFKLSLKYKLLTVSCIEPAHIYKNNWELTHKSRAFGNLFCNNYNFGMESFTKDDHTYYNASFVMSMESPKEEGIYFLFFHNCPSYNEETKTSVDFFVQIVDRNPDSYLSAEHIPLPSLYSITSIIFLLSGLVWVLTLTRSRYPVYKIHYWMTWVAFLKAISLAFHGIDYHYVERLGMHLSTWNVLFHTTHLLMDLNLVVAIVLIGSGWNVIKQILYVRDKWVLGLAVLFQTLSSIAFIITETSDRPHQHDYWKSSMVLTDLMCSILLLLPTIWSLRYLKKTLKIDYEVTDHLRRYRYFYVALVFYIYVTRIVSYLVKISVPFQYLWLSELCWQIGTYVFFVITACKFKPSSLSSYS